MRRNIEDNSKVIPNDDMFTSGNSALCSQNNGMTPSDILRELPQDMVVDHTTFKLLYTHCVTMEKTLRNVESRISDVIITLKEKDHSREIRELKIEWQIIAMTLDRFFFLIFVVAIVVSLFMMFPRPHLQLFS